MVSVFGGVGELPVAAALLRPSRCNIEQEKTNAFFRQTKKEPGKGWSTNRTSTRRLQLSSRTVDDRKKRTPLGEKKTLKNEKKKKRKRDNYEGGVKPRAVLFTAAADGDGDGDRIIAHEWKGLVRLCRQRCHFPKTHTPKGWVHTWVVFFYR